MNPAVPGSDVLTEAASEYCILISASLADRRTQVIKQGETFAVFDRRGDIHSGGMSEQGLFHRGTRHLSRLELLCGSEPPLLLGSTVKSDNIMLAVDLTNPNIREGDRLVLPRDLVHIFRTSFLWDGVCHCRWRLCNFAPRRVELPLTLRFAADFADIFEVRGQRRRQRGMNLPPVVTEQSVTLRYEGLDGAVRTTVFTFDRPPDQLSADEAQLRLPLEPRTEVTLHLQIACEGEPPRHRATCSHEEARRQATEALRRLTDQACQIHSSNDLLNQWIVQSLADLHMLISPTPHGHYPHAGIPWFSAPFGRDGLITGLQTLWVNPEIARGVLQFLAATQAQTLDPAVDAEPGKILHEMRSGEMAALGEIPFGRYYGSVDSTPLFLVLAAAHFRHTGDLEFATALWPAVEKALRWIDNHGDSDGDGFVEYKRRGTSGLIHQGWKDSGDAVFHADGSLAQPPIALCEVQAYVHLARLAIAEMAEALGHTQIASDLRLQAARLRERFNDAFWDEALGCYVLALDAEKRPCRVRTSNTGQCLLSTIATPERAQRIADLLFGESFFSGWGIRTLASTEARYNPMSYHNGSVWPHDNSLIALGLSRWGFQERACRLFGAFLEACTHFERRLPELFCGFARRQGEGPTEYPVACSPQAWSAGAVFLMLQACLGMEIRARGNRVILRHAMLPPSIDELTFRRLRVGTAHADLRLTRQRFGVGVDVIEREGEVNVEILK